MARDSTSCLLAVIILSVVGSGVASACKCVDPPTVCTGNFALRGRITNSSGNQTEHDDIIYTVNVSEVLRHPSSRSVQSPESNSLIIISTGSHSCGYPDLQTGEIYFIAGDFHAPSTYTLAKCAGLVSSYDSHGNIPNTDNDIQTCSACMAGVSCITFTICLFFYGFSTIYLVS
ncbi:uncharacterized protein LOC121424868 [Lytechinus variegatus]|uniref:uncharacterized protein LOC121424868 n=1 Tax=Lytechinus variegatus TaxID=7654 RepID=UPI001BB1F82F|nr:uncharacterized protein LOC121424868 [Lytechinus variegatus]